MPRFAKKQWVPTDPSEFEMIKKKSDKFRSRRYIYGGTVLILIALFYVPKGEYDTRLVYYLTASGLKDALWNPTFWMTLVENVLDMYNHSSWFKYMDAAEMFHNYKMPESLQLYAGVDVSWV